ncbi:MAG TPA: polysaccharide lyase family 8 super-sandwich domain-containing protein [Edaphobacter sp.]|nr:polysaccharide lyase family 8 super-sandwich domain-containing protein [Edaphobacter sp.]
MKKPFATLAVFLLVFNVFLFSSRLQAEGQLALSNGSADSEIALIRHRYILSVLPVDSVAIADLNTKSARYAASLQADGTWPDIDYEASGRSIWRNIDHLQRTLLMAKSARLKRDASRPDPRLEAKIISALKVWTSHDYQNPNWWWNEIGVPELTGEIAALMLPQLPGDQLAKVVQIMKRSNWRRVPWTGANLTWGVAIEIVRGCLQNNPDTVSEGYDRMYQEIKIVSPAEEGIQQDDSFHQHGSQLYNGGYGLAYANDVGRFISFAWGTRFQIPPDRMAIFSSYLLDGEQWMIRGGVFDYSAVGREITRQGKVAVPHDWSAGPISPAGSAYSLGNVVAMLAAEPTPRQKEFQAFAARLQGRAGAPEFAGNKQFWCSDFMAHRRKSFYTSVKMLSKRMLNGEQVNSEGKKSQHLSDGVNFLYLTGDEYKDIFPVWDWTKLPGTTTIQGTLQTGEKNPIGARGKTTFTGGVSDGTYGMAAMDLVRGNLVAKKAWFFFDDSYAGLGAAITLSDDSEHDVVTDVNQPRLLGDVFTSQTQHSFRGGLQTFKADRGTWVYHNHVGYIFGPNSQVSLSVGPQTGRWSDIGTGSNQLVTLPVFNLWIDHGRSPHDATYQYVVLPDVSKRKTAERSRHPTLDVLSNTRDVQAVYSRSLRLVEIAFRRPALLVTPLGRIEVDHSCLLMVKQMTGGWRITASNPENEPLNLNVNANGKRIAIPLPGGNFAGSSVTTEVR